MDWLRQQDPVILWDDAGHRLRLETEADWIAAGEIVFNAGVIYFESGMSVAEIEAVHFAIPPGVFARQGTSPLSPAKLPDLIGVKDRRYLDASGLVQHRSIGDLMRYAALNQGMDMLAWFGDFVTAGDRREVGGGFFERSADARYSDEQLYALALYIYSLKPPLNPNPRDALAVRGEQVFEAERCGTCHTPPLYTNNALVPAPGFTVPDHHYARFEILRRSVGTDPTLTRTTRRGTGYYKVPSLRRLVSRPVRTQRLGGRSRGLVRPASPAR